MWVYVRTHPAQTDEAVAGL